MDLSPPEWLLRQFRPNFFSLDFGGEETWVHFLPFTGKRQEVDGLIYRYLADNDLVMPRKTLAGEECFTLPTQKLAVFHPPFDGRKVDLQSLNDQLAAVRFLANFHLAIQDYKPEIRPHCTLGRLILHWERRRARLDEFTRLARYRVYPGVMDRLFLENADILSEQIRVGIERLRKASYEKICSEQGQVCFFHFHSDYLWLLGEKVYPWHFAYCHWDIPIYDLYRFIAQVGRKRPVEEWICQIIEEYGRVRPLDAREKNLLGTFFLFPERLYRLFAAFYLNRSMRAPRQQIERIEQTKKSGNEWGNIAEIISAQTIIYQ